MENIRKENPLRDFLAIIEDAEKKIEGILAEMEMAGIIISNVHFVKWGKLLQTNPPGYGCYVPGIKIQYDIRFFE